MLKVGITGGIGSGKSVVSRILIAAGYPVFNSDAAARELINHHPDIREALAGEFGPDLYRHNELDRPALAKIIFADPSARGKVNAVVHPYVREAFEQFAENAWGNLVFNEAAILFETGASERMDKMVLVTAPEEVRIARVMKRDGVSAEDVKARMRSQWSDEQKIPLADEVLINDDIQPLLAQVEAMLKRFEA